MLLPIFACGLLVPAVMALVVLVIVYALLRRSDPEHAFRRTVGIGLLVLGGLALASGGLASLATVFVGDATMFEFHWTPNSTGFQSHYNLRLGPGALSLWLFLPGVVAAGGWFLFARRFSLRSLLIGVLLVALVASIPHLVVQPRDPKTVIDARIHRVLTVEEWGVLEGALTKESLCAAVSEPVREALLCPVAAALTEIELQPQTKGDMESEGRVGVRLTLRFSHDLERAQIESIFNELTRHVQNAMPTENGL